MFPAVLLIVVGTATMPRSDASCCTENGIRQNFKIDKVTDIRISPRPVLIISAGLSVSWLVIFAVACLARVVANRYPGLPSSRPLLSPRVTILWAWLTGVLLR